MSDMYYNVFGNIEPNNSIKDYKEILLKEQYIRLNKNTNVKHNHKSKTNL
ncbi:hypothetical protein SH1V18_29620 [Vallitalea longa]|uniref:Uncharacterized protein n=1 Tax=Vallitalea longa TaxID=2936439 RepID=A0A9W6DGF1_9FIRM|nr:hypothetical protein [Vallitalea longa]GKX30482.1 hypothetical protein SH1V18_29620 [Vallitalea longa]